jgi:ketosteroid isomerase-like protein
MGLAARGVMSISNKGVQMRVFLSISVYFLVSLSSIAEESNFDYEKFTNDYFAAWANVQKPNANKADLEQYLSFLTDDVGYQHLPYSNDDSREPNGKEGMRKGMTYYLGIHTEYAAKLTNHAHGHNVIMIEFDTLAKGIHPDNGQLMSFNNHSFEVLEIENGKVSVIRHYSE